MQETDNRQNNRWVRLTVSSLEADVAYFDARLALLNGKKSSYYQLAQLRAYTELERVLSELLVRLRARPGRGQPAAPRADGRVDETTDSISLKGVLSDSEASRGCPGEAVDKA